MLPEYQQPPLLLIVDDDPFMRGMLQNLLKKEGYRIAVASEGRKALEEFQRNQPDLVLMDAAMPIMDGFKACIELKKLKSGADVPVIIITSLDDEQSVDKAFESGAVEYVTKPVHWAVLRHRVEVILRARHAKTALRQSEANFRGIFEQSAMGIALVNIDGQLIHCNLATQKILGFDEAALRKKLFNKFFLPIDTVIEKEFFEQLLNGSRSHYQMEKYVFQQQTDMLWVRLTTSLVNDTQGRPQYLIQMIEDITERKQAEAKQRLSAKVFETTSDGVMIMNAEGHIVDVNHAFLLMTGYNYQDILDKNPLFLLQPERHEKTFFEELYSIVRDTGHWQGKTWHLNQNGHTQSIWMSMSAVRGEHNEVTHYVAVYSNISTLKEENKRMRWLTHYDSLTELPNSLLFKENLTRAYRQQDRIALLLMDLDDFKQFNEHYGYDIGDEILKIIAQRLKQCIREGDSVSRLESDEFGIILSPIHQDYEASVIADKIFNSITQPIFVNEQAAQVDCNLGIRFYPDILVQEQSIDRLIEEADMAMYLAKEAGKNTYHIYTHAPLANESV
jgi:diguanylate cyclase (GGDEF)-like protein/PAS domain S-box-containing protein